MQQDVDDSFNPNVGGNPPYNHKRAETFAATLPMNAVGASNLANGYQTAHSTTSNGAPS